LILDLKITRIVIESEVVVGSGPELDLESWLRACTLREKYDEYGTVVTRIDSYNHIKVDQKVIGVNPCFTL
jgi:hypothetical protein